MTSRFRNTLLPHTAGESVCEALIRWHGTLGFRLEKKRALFNFRFEPNDTERRCYIIWNQQWTLVLYSNDSEEGVKFLQAFEEFPAALQVWARDVAWGYRLEERGKLSAAYSSKKEFAAPDEGGLGKRGNPEKTCTICGTPGAASRVMKTQKKRSLFKGNAVMKFCAALGVPIGTLDFVAVDWVYKGNTEIIEAGGWKIKMLAFRREYDGQKPALSNQPRVPALEDLSVEEQAEVQGLIRKARWLKLLLAPFLFAAGLLGMVVFMIASLGIISFSLLPGVGKTPDRRFLKELEAKLHPVARVKGGVLINDRHACSVSLPEGVRDVTNLPAKQIPFNDGHVFSIEYEDIWLACEAFPPGQIPKWANVEVLTSKPITAGPLDGQFELYQTKVGRRLWVCYRWLLHTDEAEYNFSFRGKKRLALEQETMLENIVLSFRNTRT